MTQASSSVASFAELGIIAPLGNRLTELGYVSPTPVQAATIPAVLSGRDVLAGANTGSGKTAAFALPLLQRLSEAKSADKSAGVVRCLVLVPTRELAQQVADSFLSYASHFNGQLKIVAAFGGVSVNLQMQSLRAGADVLVATPGRLLDLLASNALKLTQVSAFVLDEADRMLSLGFTEELEQVLAALPRQKQTLLFSATFPEEVRALTTKLLHQPLEYHLQSEQESTIEQRVITVNREQKTALLAHLIKQHQWSQALIFVSAKNTCNHLAQKLSKRGISAEVFHGDKAQGARTRVLDGFKNGEISVLIATDIAARGIDIDKLPVVINFDLPRSPADYMHRIGRSGRAGEAGLAVTLISHEEYHHFGVIEKKNKIKLVREQIPGFEANAEIPLEVLAQEKPQAKPEGTGKKKRKQLPAANVEFWGKKS
ncbi:DEAD/DEAH box helicase [Shewanella oneidensis MR-1]|uniref:ATP-dependent RNA helicase DEAD box family n=1 Tax=Shewanella oneidensis (strain ATCC 700550 / JCM 31522 / CIP 106686 / LMG 19005 / NCIMB 14063 / MR-1) TaxID=211586 RepID=Q8ECL2_SHEON|nr:DEAD/DEAH box helicase [Shewanella oneidensis]AAN56130.1 ATP-dependent RNA helicase DEAD box family [Shewanella oneidensis MR-1]MDX5999437.1 DEAD/DEAH box helicase [Shewanella oneidensis]MEE2028270.1 ATP-dependent RNA helicase RhlE [Shewanella oneidensis]QKG97565.1 DEAD/DEAH box helicase [Shewanella oneidensis MR-1]